MSSSRLVGMGIFVVGGILLFTVGLFLIGDRRMLFKESFEIYTEFETVTGLQNGAKVRVAGKDAGEVLEIQIPPGPSHKFRIKLRLIEDLHPLVRSDSVASIQTDGLVGNKFLQISAGSEQAPPAKPESTIPSREPFDFTDLMLEATDAVRLMKTATLDVKEEVESAIEIAIRTVGDVQGIVNKVGDDASSITGTGKEIVQDLHGIVRNIQDGQGTLGKFVTDDQFYRNANTIVSDARESAQNVKDATRIAKSMVEDLQKKDPAGGSLLTDVRQTVSLANEALGDMSESMEALKHNWFFRGFFKNRGYYDLGSLTLPEYRDGVLEKDRRTKRVWLSAEEMFYQGADGSLRISDQGKEKLNEAMAEMLPYYVKNAILMVEGYAGEGTLERQYLLSRERSMELRNYLVKRFYLNPLHVGTMAMGAATSSDSQEGPYEGVSLVLFYDEDARVPVR